MRASDEYMSLVLEERLAQLSAALGGRPARASTARASSRGRARVVALAARGVRRYRARYGYLALTSASAKGEAERADARAARMVGGGEYFTYRASMLKKHVQQALYLDVRGSRGDTYLRNAVSAVGAALAAIWALAAQVPTQIAVTCPPTRSALLFAGAVVAYVLKDRIKANTSEFLLKRARTFDHAHQVYGEQLAELGIGDFVARSSEAVRFVSSPEALEPRCARCARSGARCGTRGSRKRR